MIPRKFDQYSRGFWSVKQEAKYFVSLLSGFLVVRRLIESSSNLFNLGTLDHELPFRGCDIGIAHKFT